MLGLKSRESLFGPPQSSLPVKGGQIEIQSNSKLERRTVASTSGGAVLPADCAAIGTIAERLAAVTFLAELHTGIGESTSSAEVSAYCLGHRGRSGSSTGEGAAGGTFNSAPDLRPSTRKGRLDGDEARGGRVRAACRLGSGAGPDKIATGESSKWAVEADGFIRDCQLGLASRCECLVNVRLEYRTD